MSEYGKYQGGAKMSLITITSGIGCGEMRIARRVADGLDLKLYDDQRLQEKAVEMGLSLEDLRGSMKRLLDYSIACCGANPKYILPYWRHLFTR
jgi:hypothetical protein